MSQTPANTNQYVPQVQEIQNIDGQIPMLLGVRAYPSTRPGKFLGEASYSLNNTLCVRRAKIFDGRDGPTVFQPSEKLGETYKSLVFSLDKRFDAELNACILHEYDLAMEAVRQGEKPRQEGKYIINGDPQTLAMIAQAPVPEQSAESQRQYSAPAVPPAPAPQEAPDGPLIHNASMDTPAPQMGL